MDIFDLHVLVGFGTLAAVSDKCIIKSNCIQYKFLYWGEIVQPSQMESRWRAGGTHFHVLLIIFYFLIYELNFQHISFCFSVLMFDDFPN